MWSASSNCALLKSSLYQGPATRPGELVALVAARQRIDPVPAPLRDLGRHRTRIGLPGLPLLSMVSALDGRDQVVEGPVVLRIRRP